MPESTEPVLARCSYCGEERTTYPVLDAHEERICVPCILKYIG